MIKKLFLTLLILLFLALGSTAFLYFFWYLELPRVQEARGAIQNDFVLDLDPVNVPVIRKGSVSRYIVFQISLTFEDEIERNRASAKINSLRDRFFSSLHQYTEILTNEQSLNKTTLELRLTQEAQEVLGVGRIKRVIVTGAFERR